MLFVVSRVRSTSEKRKPMTMSDKLELGLVIFECVVTNVTFGEV